MSTFTVQSENLVAVADAIRTKRGGTFEQYQFPGDFITNILAIDGGGGGGEVGKGNVRFVDYDGTIIKKWSIDDVNMASELPTNPTHDGLIAQGWNWTLQDIQAYMSSYPQATLTVGQMYTTSDGSTRVYVEFPENTPNNRMTFPLVLDGSGATIDWGDGNTTDVYDTQPRAYEHTYMSPGEYVITITHDYSQIAFRGTGMESDPTSCIFGARDAAHAYNATRIKKIELGSNVTVSAYAFAGCLALESITIPDSIGLLGTDIFDGCIALRSLTLSGLCNSIDMSMCKGCSALKSVSMPPSVGYINEGAFSGCTTLEAVAIPSTVTAIDQYMFDACVALTSVTIPDGVYSIGDYAFQGCTALPCVTIPENVNMIGAGAFEMCDSIGEYRVKASSPPSLQSVSDITVPSDCVIYVPGGCMSDYTSAYGWGDYASQIQEDWG